MDHVMVLRAFGRYLISESLGVQDDIAPICDDEEEEDSPIRGWVLRGLDGRILNVEFVWYADEDPSFRMVRCRERLKGRYPGHQVEQVLVVAGEGNPPDNWEQDGDRFTYRVVKMRDLDPEPLFASAGTAPFAVLGRAGCLDDRIRLFRRAVDTIWRVAEGGYRLDLLSCAATYAHVYLSAEQIDQAWKDSDAPIALRSLDLFCD